MVFFIKIKILLMLIMHFSTVSVNFLYCILVIDVALLFCILETFITNTIMKQYRDKIKILTTANSIKKEIAQ
jgi:ABC-type polysaccharide/polyol phosphate export permease